jgi:hypothetical protein
MERALIIDGQQKSGWDPLFCCCDERAPSLGMARTMEISETLQEWRNHQANNRHHVDQNVH